MKIHTSRNLLHEYLDVTIFRHRAQVLHNVAMLQVLVQGNLFMERLGIPGKVRTS